MNHPARFTAEGSVPLINCEGTAFTCGEQLGIAWQHALRKNAGRAKGRWTPWWWKGRGGVVADLVETIAPHLVDIHRGLAKGAGIAEELCAPSPITQPLEDCTSFAVHQDQTLDGHAITGQTKDTGQQRTSFYQVVRLRPTDAPGFLTLTYPGELFGYGFGSTGMSLFRNALYVTPQRPGGVLPLDAFGLLALFSHTLEDVIEMARRHGVRTVAHSVAADASGRVVGLEMCQGETEIIKGRDGLYAHANHTVSPRFQSLESDTDAATQRAGASEHRQRRLYELLEQDRGRLTPQLMLRHLSDHANHPLSICCHRDRDYHTTAAVVAEPGRGLLHVTRGPPCQNWPVTYRL